MDDSQGAARRRAIFQNGYTQAESLIGRLSPEELRLRRRDVLVDFPDGLRELVDLGASSETCRQDIYRQAADVEWQGRAYWDGVAAWAREHRPDLGGLFAADGAAPTQTT